MEVSNCQPTIFSGKDIRDKGHRSLALRAGRDISEIGNPKLTDPSPSTLARLYPRPLVGDR